MHNGLGIAAPWRTTPWPHRCLAAIAVLAAAVGIAVGPGARSATAQSSCFGAVPTIFAVAGTPTVGTPGDDVIWGTPGPDDIRGRGGDDRICSRGGADRVAGNGGRDLIDLGSGHDAASGGRGADTILGGSGRDIIRGGSGNDDIDGGRGRDQLHGGPGADLIRGRSGRDLLRGNSGPDDLRGGTGADACSGGKGSDATASCSPVGSTRFTTLAVGASLPSGPECALLVDPTGEVRTQNKTANTTPGTNPHDEFPRVKGDFVGTTDEIIQWAACKHGIDEDLARAQMVIESWWDQAAGGDLTTDQSLCHPTVRTSSGPCPESVGLSQIRFAFHGPAYEDENALRSTAYNVDYAYDLWRRCFEGELTWLNTVERGRDYAAGDALGCLGVWFSGRWYTDDALGYIDRVVEARDDRTWESPEFLGANAG